MKKNISINLQGIIFQIEEDGYEQLSRYLASIRTYFSNYEGHEEIVADIEARVAEIFSARVSASKQVITQEDVQYLITRMGNVTDFEVEEPQEEAARAHATAGAGAGAAEEGTASGAYDHTSAGPKKLYRDMNHKVIAGVSSGIGNYLRIDPLWIRLCFVLLVLLGVFSAGVSAATGMIIYVILWIAMPETNLLPETKVRKLFRDPDDKKLAGVASGIAKYFGVDATVVRLLFLVSIFLGGFGIFAYIVLWIAMPEAVTLTERMQMQGDPVTLAGIERTLKENLNMRDSNGEESTLAKILLLPIRLVSQVVNWIGRALGPVLAFLITLIRVTAGILLLIISIGLTVALFSAFFVSLGIITEPENFTFGNFPASAVFGGFPRLGLVAGFFVGLIPLLLLMVLAVSLLIKRTFMRPIVGWSMFGVWLVALFTLIATSVMFGTNFKRSGEVVTSRTIPVGDVRTLTLDAYDTGMSFDRIYIEVQESSGADVELVQRVEAKGRTEEEAQQNARMITYRAVLRDSTLRFDDSYEFKPGAVYRDQELSLTLKLPKDKPLRLTNSFYRLLPSSALEGDYSRAKVLRNTWQVNGNRLQCLTCAADTLDTETEASMGGFTTDMGEGESVLLNESDYSSNSQAFNFRDFKRITVSGPYHVQLRQGDSYAVVVRAKEQDLKRMELDMSGDELEISSDQKVFRLFSEQDPVLIRITAPDIHTIELNGAIKADLGTIKGENLRLNLSGAIQSVANLNVRNLRVDAAGATASTFFGKAERFELDATGACVIRADKLEASYVDADVTGAGVAEVYASNTLRADASGTSHIVYRGNPKDKVIDSSGPSTVKSR